MKWYIWVLIGLGSIQVIKAITIILGAAYEHYIDEFYDRKIQGQFQVIYQRLNKLEQND